MDIILPEMKSPRTRRSPEEARQLVLETAEKLMTEGGLPAVQMRAVAREAGITDAGVAHHFGNRDGLLVALMGHGSAKVRTAVSEAVSDWLRTGPDIRSFVTMLREMYANGYAALALQVHGSGWEDRGPVLLKPAVDALYAQRRNPDVTKDDIRVALASLHLWLALDPLFGDAFRRSAGLAASASSRQVDWWIQTLESRLG